MPKIKRAYAFTPDGQKKASKILYYIVQHATLGNVREFTQIYNMSLKARGYKEIKEGKEVPLSYDHSLLDKLISMWRKGHDRSQALIGINPKHFEYFEPFYPDNITVQQMFNIAKGTSKPPSERSLKFSRLDTAIQSLLSGDYKKHLANPSSIRYVTYVVSHVDEKPKMICAFTLTEELEMKTDKDSVYSMSIESLERLSSVLEISYQTRKKLFPGSAEINDPYVKTLFTEDAVLWNVNGEMAGEVSIAVEVLEKLSHYCYKIARWDKKVPVLCPVHTYEGDWKKMIENLDSVESRNCICKD